VLPQTATLYKFSLQMYNYATKTSMYKNKENKNKKVTKPNANLALKE